MPPELLKQGGRTLKQKLYKLILMIWNNEQLPQQRNEGIICPVYKKGDRLNCNNYRPITTWSRVLLEKLTGSAARQKIPLIFGTRMFITVLTSARHLSLS